jgi:hypothetical protein
MPTEASRKVKHNGGAALFGLWATMWTLFRAVLAFLAATAVVALVGLAYSAIRRRGFGPDSVSWILRLTWEQLVALGFGALVAVALLSIVWRALSRHGGLHGLLRKAAALAVLALYLWGSYCAYHVSRSRHKSLPWAAIHSLYSWPYVGFSFGEWASEYPKQPLSKTLRQFSSIMGM